MTIGIILIIIGAFILVIGAKGTYQYLPPWNQNIPPPPEKAANNPIDTAGMMEKIINSPVG